jgi:tetratricopeptide (TPR) repeat protein
MQKSGKAEEAFRALKEFAALYPDQDDVRLILAELLSKENRKGEAIEQLQALYEKLESEGRQAEARATVDRMKAIDPTVEPRITGSQPVQQAADLVFLDLTDDAPRSGTESGAAPAAPTPAVVAPVRALDGLKLTFVPDEDTTDVPPPAGFEATAADEDLGDESIEVLDDLEATASDPVEIIDSLELESVLDAEELVQVERLQDLEPTAAEPAGETDSDADTAAVPDLEPFDLEAGIEEGAAATAEPESARERELAPLSESEFAVLPLADLPRPAPVRAHDLVLPGDLPGTPGLVRTIGGTPTSAAAADDARTAAEEEADLMADIAAREATQGHGTWPPHPAYPAGHDAGAATSRGEPADKVEAAPDEAAVEPPPGTADETLPASGVDPDAAAVDDVDFLTLPPTFGAPESSGEFAFSPLPGLNAPEGGMPADTRHWNEMPDEAPVDEAVEEPAMAARGHSPRSTLSIGGAEDHLRQRLELEPENWQLRRMLGEAMLDTGNREGGLQELELAMAGFELDGDIDRAAEVIDEVLRISSSSIRHHQKRVEYAVRARDRRRLIEAYLELADSLFRNGTADKAVSVYTRVLELDAANDRAEFALATLAPDELARVRGAPLRPGSWSDELEAIPDPAVSVGPPAADASGSTGHVATNDVDATGSGEALSGDTGPDDAAGAIDEAADEIEDVVLHLAGETPLDDHEAPAAWKTAPAVPEQESAPDELAAMTEFAEPGLDVDESPAVEATASEFPIDSFLDESAAEGIDEVGDGIGEEEMALDSGPAATPEFVEEAAATANLDVTGPDAPEKPSETAAPVTEHWETTPETPEPASRLDRARSMTPAMASDSDFVDLGEWLRATEPTRSTRMQVEDPQPTGDEQADFEELLRRFKRGVAENVEAEDYEAHYDLGVAYKEMGLTDEAIAQFQKALRGEHHRVSAYEALGQCFVEKEQYPIAAALLKRATELPGTDDQQLVGVLYLLGFATEHLGRPEEALPYYLRVFAVDIEFRDVAERVAAMGNLTT